MIARMYADVNFAFGDIVKVTPSSKVVGDLALYLVSHDMTVQELEKLPRRPSVNSAEFRGGHVHGFSGSARRRLAA